MPLYQREKGGVWYVDVRRRGGRTRRSTGTRDREEAQRQYDALANRAWQEKRGNRRLSEALLIWLDERPRSDRLKSDVKQLRRLFGDPDLADIDQDMVSSKLAGKKPGTYNKLLSTLKAALRLAAGRGWCEYPKLKKRREQPEIEARALTAKEWKALRAELPPHIRRMAEFALATGLRWANVAGLTWERVDLRRELVWIPGTQAKARKPIGLPLSREALEVLQNVKEEGLGRLSKTGGYVFTYRGQPLGRPDTGWREACKRAGLDGFRWHWLRHTWATWHALNGTPIEVLQQLGAWQTREMAARYSHLSPSYVAGWADNAKGKAA